MTNKVKTRADHTSPNKNKIQTLVGAYKQSPDYQDLLDFKIEVNGVEQPVHTFYEKLLDRIDKLEATNKRLIGEVSILNQQLDLYRKAVSDLDTRLDYVENKGNL